ncbi:hypothetical protein AB5J62_15130 [Amycolatopsis sp. cg5]|uniref:hypothetical protein n=1 Tax=Amycolatopsis sp. cg5 TaxID=3238802 RepID=UPI003525495F
MADSGDRVARIADLQGLGQALIDLRTEAELSIRMLAAEACKMNNRPCDLSKNLIEDMSKGRRITEDNLRLYLRVCDVPRDEWWSWIETLHRANGKSAARPEGAHRVRDWDPVYLGVHRAIEMPGFADGLPSYVGRDLDDELRSDLRTMAGTGGFVVLVGWSSAGKSRSAYEAVTAELPNWWLVSSAPGAVPTKLPARTVLWLDELGEHFEPSQRLRADAVRRLLSAPEPVIIVGTLWPNRYAALASLESPGPAVEVLKMAKIVEVDDHLTEREQNNAKTVALTDIRIATALRVTDYSLTQTLTAAPALLRRWRLAPPVARAVISAAIDARDLGVNSPVSRDFLTDAAPGYLTQRERRSLTATQFNDAFTYATTLLHGVTATLWPESETATATHFSVAEYLTQQVPLRLIPETTWLAIIEHVLDKDDLERVADSAQGRLLYRIAEKVYRHSNTVSARLKAADLLVQRGQAERAVESLADLAKQGNVPTLRWISDFYQLRKAGSSHEAHGILSRLAETTNDDSDRIQLARFLDRLEHPDTLEEWKKIAERNVAAARRAASLLVARKLEDEAIELLLPWAAKGDRRTRDQVREFYTNAGRLAEIDALSKSWGDAEYAETLAWRSEQKMLLKLAEEGNSRARVLMAGILEEEGKLTEALCMSQQWIEDGGKSELLIYIRLCTNTNKLTQAIEALTRLADDSQASSDQARFGEHADEDHEVDLETVLVDLLYTANRIDDLRACADTGSVLASIATARWLRENEEIATLTARAQGGDFDSLQSLTEYFREKDRLAEAVHFWEAAVLRDPGRSREQLGDVLDELGRTHEALEIAEDMGKNGDRSARSRVARRMAKLAMWDKLRNLADASDRYADIEHIRHLSELRKYTEIQQRAAAGSVAAVRELLAAAHNGIAAAAGIDDFGLEPSGIRAAPASDDVQAQ